MLYHAFCSVCVLNCSLIDYNTVTIILILHADESSVPCSPVLHVLCVLNCSLIDYNIYNTVTI